MTRTLHTFSAVLFLIAGAVFRSSGTDTDPNDAVLLSYQLTPAEEEQFNSTDGSVSAFWQVAKERNLDKVHMTPENAVVSRKNPEGFLAGMDDAQLAVWSAWGEKGLYFLFEALDDDYVGYILTSGVAEYNGSTGDRRAESWNDAIELRLDQHSSEELTENYEALFPEFPDPEKSNGNSLTMAQYGYRFGGEQPDEEIEIFRRNPSYDPLLADSGSSKQSLEYLWERYEVSEDAPSKGIYIEVIMGEANFRSQEWLIAWNQIGLEGSFVKPAPGKKIAAIFGYSDTDQGYTGTREDALRWRQAESFWKPKEKGLSAWGDIEFVPDNMSVAKPISVRYAAPQRHVKMVRNGIQRFTPAGRKISGNPASSAIAITRLNGFQSARMDPVLR